MLRERVFLGGQAVSMLGDGLAILAIPLLVMQLTRSPLAAVLASLPGSVGYLAAGLPAGVLADRVSPWLVLIAGDAIRAPGMLHGAMLIDALTFLVSLASLAGVRRRYRPAGTAGRKAVTWRALGQELAEGIRHLAATRLLLTLLVFLLTLNLCLGADKLIIFLGNDTLHLPPGQVGFLVTAGGVGGLAGAAGTGRLCRWLAPLPVVALCCAGSGLALVLISVATAMSVLLAGNFLYTWAIVAASVTMRSLRQVLVPRDLLGRVTASWRLGGQTVILVGGVLAGALASLLGGDPRPVIAAAGCLTLLTVTVAWFASLQKENASGVAVRLLGK